MYVKVRNRGSATATGVSVSGYSCQPGTGLVWPDDWTAMSPSSLSGANIPSGGVVTVGPFEWTPMSVGHECILAIASATGDPGNDVTVTGSIPHNRFVPFDNNIGQRNVAPVAGGGGSAALMASFADRRFLFRNPHNRTIEAELELHLPSFLATRGWGLMLRNPGGDRFTLGPRAAREIVLSLERGEDFLPGDVPNQPADRSIEIVSLADGIPVGGMTYGVDPGLKQPPRERPERGEGEECVTAAKDLLGCLGLGDVCVDKAKIKSVIVEIQVDDCC
jgi:hypothetical protein